MFFPIGWPKVLHSAGATCGGPIKVLRHRTRDLVIELRTSSVAIWHARLNVLLVSYSRSQQSLDVHGANTNVAMKPDGAVLLISTAKGFLLILKVNYEKPRSTTDQLYATKEHGIMVPGTYDVEVAGEGTCPDVITLKLANESYIASDVNSLLCVGNQLVVCTQGGCLHRIGWDGRIEKSSVFNLFDVPIANDMLPESRGVPIGPSSLQCVAAVYSVELQGFAVVLSDGRSIFIRGNSAKLDAQPLQGVWFKELNDAICVAVNPKYRLISFGRQNGAVDIYTMDETNETYTWSLLQTFQLTKRQFPETGFRLGPVQSMDWSAGDGMVIALSWKNGGLSVWSVFGSLLMCSLGDQPGTPSPLNPHCIVLESLCWSGDGYHLWMLPEDQNSPPGGGEHAVGSPGVVGNAGTDILVMRFVKNSIVNNPTIANHHHILLQGADRLLLNTAEGVVCVAVPPNGPGSQQSGGMYTSANEMASSPQWRVIQLPLSYLILNWPVKYVAMDSTATNIAVAGKCGFALYSGAKRKWKLFGNELQEQSLVCRGGLAWFQEVVVFPCQIQDGSDEVQFYSLQSNLDFSQRLLSLKLASPVVSLNLHGNHLVLASRDCHLIIYELSLNATAQGEILSADLVFETSMVRYLTYPWASTLVSVVPSNISTEPVAAHSGRDGAHINSVFFNVSGKLLMVQQDQPHYPYKVATQDHTSSTVDKHLWSFGAPVIVASAVEAVWIPHTSGTADVQEDYLMESLWLSCGAEGVKVWLPLYPRNLEQLSFLSKRVMLTLPLDMYPQAVLFKDAILFGLSHETSGNDSSNSSHSFPYATVERSTHIFLHHILRLLLRRNLGSHAFQIARSCLHLPYFYHVLELMLHEVLEEEAPRTMPMPDALLPRVVEFIKQFPQFLETVGSCARKTEVALWQYLFAAVGNPRDLFELCLSDGRLKTAACYLIIIQNLESSAVSRQLATRLLDAALDSNEWEVVVDLVRFLRAIGPGDAMDSPAHSMTSPISPGNVTPKLSRNRGSFTSHIGRGTSPFTAPPDLDRSARDHLPGGPVSISANYKDSSGRIIKRPQFVVDVDTKEEYFIEMILSRHARKLLLARCMKDLGKFVAYLNFDLQGWMARERCRAARIENFTTTLRDLHKQFQWPFPTTSSIDTSRIAGHSSSNALPVSGHANARCSTSKNLSSELCHDNDTLSSSLRRATRPPDLDLSPNRNVVVANCKESKSELCQKVKAVENYVGNKQFDPTQSSTPTKLSDSIVSEGISLLSKNNMSSMDMHVEQGSLGDALDETEWDVAPDDPLVSIHSMAPKKLFLQTESEIRYFAKVAQEALCLDWTMLLGVLLLDEAIVRQAAQWAGEKLEVLTVGGVAKVVQEMEDLSLWASVECPGYKPFLESIDVHMDTLRTLQKSGTGVAEVVSVDTLERITLTSSLTSVANSFSAGNVATSTTSGSAMEQPNVSRVEDTLNSPAHPKVEEDTGSGCSVS